MRIKVEIADTPASLAQGLMWRKQLDKNSGMLFKFPQITEARFWGKNTYLPLDIAFIHDDKIVDIKQIVPLSTRMVHSNNMCTMAVETNVGFFKENNINVGHKVVVHDNEIEFIDA